MKGLSYLGLEQTGFGWEVKVRLEIVILLPRRRHRFFLRRMSASFADLEKSCEFVFHNFSFFTCWAIRHPSFQADGGWLFSVIIA